MREYRFPYGERGPFVRTLGWDLLASLDLLLVDPYSPSTEARYRPADGVILVEDGVIVIGLHDDRELTDDEYRAIEEAVEASWSVPDVWSGRELHDVAGRFAASVGRVLVKDKAGVEHFGTGFLYLQRDMLATAAHVVDPDHQELSGIQFPTRQVGGKLVNLDRKADVALVKLSEAIPASPVAVDLPQADIRAGRNALVIGYPNVPGVQPALSFMPVRPAAVKRSYLLGFDVVELSTHLAGGFSGSPVIDAGHTLVGVVLGHPDREDADGVAADKAAPWTALAVPSETLRARVEQWLR